MSVSEQIYLRHLHVSRIPTPKQFIEDKGGMEYVKGDYMRAIALQHYAPISWEIIRGPSLVDLSSRDDRQPEWLEIEGRLIWHEEVTMPDGTVRLLECHLDVPTAGRIAYKRDSSSIVDFANDRKSINTDCMKKAFNLALNISDDVYRWKIPHLSPEEIAAAEKIISQIAEQKPDLAQKYQKRMYERVFIEDYPKLIKALQYELDQLA